jgi:hypothetical protein
MIFESDHFVPVIEILNFEFIWNLSIVILDFSAVSGKSNLFYLNPLKLTLTFLYRI